MNWMDRLALFTPLDFAAVALILVFWGLISWRVEHSSSKTPSVSAIMGDYRREWMRQMITREPRIFDAQIVSTLRQSTAFFCINQHDRNWRHTGIDRQRRTRGRRGPRPYAC